MAQADVAIITLVSDESLYERACATYGAAFGGALPMVIAVRPNVRGWNAATALNHGLDKAAGAGAIHAVCAHQDVFLPDGWWTRACAQLNAWRSPIGVAGLVGKRRWGRFRGHIQDPTGHKKWGPLPCEVFTLDEHVLILPAATRLRFDTACPGFHCYGADICLEARSRGLAVVTLDAPVLHLSKGNRDQSYFSANEWMLDKWGVRHAGVIPTTAYAITRATPIGRLKRRIVRAIGHRDTKRGRGACACDALRSVEHLAEVDRARS